jgi:glycerate kinase
MWLTINMHILIAPNAFKNSLSAIEVADAIKYGLYQSSLQFTSESFPIGDGGDGTGELIINKFNGSSIPSDVHDPLGRIITSKFGLIDEGRTAVIEMADASGLRLLNAGELNPLRESSYGTGELMKLALNKGVKKIIIGLGGSATVDGGSGILKALGFRFLDQDGNELSAVAESLMHLESIDVSGLDQRILDCDITVLCDVEIMLLGREGAATVFGPQKGAGPDDIEMIEKALEKFAAIILKQTGRDTSAIKYGGAAGGAASGLFAFLNAKLVNGIDHFLHLTGFDNALDKTDIVITGEGSIDEQTLKGKGPFGVAAKAKQKGIPVIGLAGKVPLTVSNGLKQYFDVLMPIGNEPADLKHALQHTKENLIRTAKEIGQLLCLKEGKTSGRF